MIYNQFIKISKQLFHKVPFLDPYSSASRCLTCSEGFITVKKCGYLNDIQVYLSFTPEMLEQACTRINEDLNVFTRALFDHCLQINPNKANVILFDTKINRNHVANSSELNFNSVKLKLVLQARNLGIILDSDLTFVRYINPIS